MVDDGPRRSADQGRRSEHAQADGQDGIRAVAVGRLVELRLRFTALVVVEDELVVVGAGLSGSDAGTDEGEYPGSGHVAPGRDLLLRHARPRGGERDDGLLQPAAREHLAAGVVGPLVLRVHARRERELQKRCVRAESEDEVSHAHRSAVARRHGLREGREEPGTGVLSFRARADREPVGHVRVPPVVGREAERRAEVGRGLRHVVRGVEDADGHVAEGLEPTGDVRPRDAPGAQGHLVVRVAALGESGVQEVELHVLTVLAEFGANAVDGGVELRERGVEQPHDAGVFACAERVRGGVGVRGELLHVRCVLELGVGVRGPTRHHHREHGVLGLPAERRDLDEMFLGEGWGRGGGRGGGREGRKGGEEKEQDGHGFLGLRKGTSCA